MLLRKHSAFQATSTDALDHLLRTVAAGRVRNARPIDGKADFLGHAAQSERFSLFSLASTFSATFDFDPFDDLRLVFQAEPVSHVLVGGRRLEVGQRDYLLPRGVEVTEEHPHGYQSLAVRLSEDDLRQKLEALIGSPLSADIAFGQPTMADERFLRFVRRPLILAAHELDQADVIFHPNILEEIRAVTVTRLLLFAPHSFSNLLARHDQSPSRNQMKVAEDYLAANWNRALDVSGLAETVGVSARTVLRYFREAHGETPRDYMRRIRLGRAHEMLVGGGDTVTEVALRCGFSSLGNFAAAYHRQFGELPGATLRRGR